MGAALPAWAPALTAHLCPSFMTSVLCPHGLCDSHHILARWCFCPTGGLPGCRTSPAALSWLQSRYNPSTALTSSPQARTGCCLYVHRPHRSFHDITSRGSRHQGPWGITSNQGSENVYDKVPLLLTGWPWLYDPCGLVATNYEGVSVKASLVPISLYRRYHSVFFPQNLSLLHPAFCIINWHQKLFII